MEKDFEKITEEELAKPIATKKKSRWWALGVAGFLILLMAAFVLPMDTVKWDPAPRDVPQLKEVLVGLSIDVNNETNLVGAVSPQDYKHLVTPQDPTIKVVADRVAAQSCPPHATCTAKALFYFVRDNFAYVPDPAKFEFVKSPKMALASTAGDCDDASVLLANLLQSVGIRTRFAFVPGHVWVQAWIPDARKHYKVNDKNSWSYGWINVDATCHNCDFGELAPQYQRKKMSFV